MRHSTGRVMRRITGLTYIETLISLALFALFVVFVHQLLFRYQTASLKIEHQFAEEMLLHTHLEQLEYTAKSHSHTWLCLKEDHRSSFCYVPTRP